MITHEFSSIWKCISCSTDVMNRDDCVVKLDVYPLKMGSCSETILCISFFSGSKNIRGISRKKHILGVLLNGHSVS